MENKTNLKETVVNFFKNLSKPARIGIIAGAVALVLVIALVIGLAVGGKDNGNNNNDNGTNNGTTDNGGNNDNGGNDNNTPTEVDYKLAIVVDDGFKTVSKGGVTTIALALVYDADGKIVAARFDSAQPKFALNADKTDMVAVNRVDTKVELGDAYTGMSDSWKDEAAAFEAFLVGKTAAEIAALEFVVDGADAGLVAGCTMLSSMPTFKALVAKAFAYERAVSFKTAETVTLGLAIDAKVSGSVAEGGKVSADFAAVAIAGGKVVASMLDSAEAKYDLAIGETTGKNGTVSTSLTVTFKEYKGTKNEQGTAYDAYSPMAAGTWYVQAQNFANTAVGKTVAELADLSTDAVTGSCTIYSGGYKAVIVRAAGYAR